MACTFPPDVSAMIAASLHTGAYQTEDDVLRSALQALQEQEAHVVTVPMRNRTDETGCCEGMKVRLPRADFYH